MQRSLSPREELLRLQQKIFKQNDEFIRSQTVVQETGFLAYERQYKKKVRAYQRVCDGEELLEAVAEADIIYLGDYHTNQQSQRMLLRLLKLMKEQGHSVVVGLELVQRKHQGVLEKYIKGSIREETFLKRVHFEKYWYYDLWPNFKPIFDYAKYHKLPLYGIEKSLSGDLSLEERDSKNAETVAKIVRAHPESKVVIFAGDLHVAPEHLPDKTLKCFKRKKRKDLILYQNSESIYWKLAEKGLEQKTEIVRIDERSFCLLNTPPIVWQQSYLNWLEHEEGTIDYVDAKHSFLDLILRIASFLGIKPNNKDLEEVEVFTCGDLSFLRRLEEDGSFSKKELLRIKKQILSSESYCIPSKKYVYLANLSINHAAEEAAHYLKFICSGPEEPRYLVDAFYANALHEAFGFFGSKIINHKRKCFHVKDYEGLVSYLVSAKQGKARRLELEMSLLILEHKQLEKKGDPLKSRRFFKLSSDLFFGVTHGLGYILGDKLYYGMLQGKIKKSEMEILFHDPIKEEGEPFDLYRTLLKRVRGVKVPKRV